MSRCVGKQAMSQCVERIYIYILNIISYQYVYYIMLYAPVVLTVTYISQAMTPEIEPSNDP